MTPQPELKARETIDLLLTRAGWRVSDAALANISAARVIAIREFPLPGHGFADYLLYIDGKAAGVIKAKKEGTTPHRCRDSGGRQSPARRAASPINFGLGIFSKMIGKI